MSAIASLRQPLHQTRHGVRGGLCYGPLKRILFAASRSEANVPPDTMTAIIASRVRVCSIAVAILLYAIDAVVAQPVTGIKLNDNAVAFATQRIKEGHFTADGKGAWREHRPSADQENEFIRLHGFGEYAKWHLAVDERYAENTKRRYKFPYGDFSNVHRCGLLAARIRAAEYRYHDVEDAAVRLIQMIAQKKQRVDAGL
jgi:hypothetical protein